MSKWPSTEPLTEEEERQYRRLSVYPASKMSASDLKDYSQLVGKRARYARLYYRKWLSATQEIQRCLDLSDNDFTAALEAVEQLSVFDSRQKLGPRPTQQRLAEATATKHDKLLGLTQVLIRFEAIDTRLNNVLDVALDIWQGLSTQDSEWKMKGEWLSFETIRKLRFKRSRTYAVLSAARKLNDLLASAHAVESRLVEIGRQQLELDH